MNWSYRIGQADALSKFAAAPPVRIMEQILRSREPNYRRAATLLPMPTGKDLIQTYRDTLRGGSTQVELPQRLENFKFWKRTGDVPALKRDLETKKLGPVTDPARFNIDRPVKYEKDPSPIALTSYGGQEGLTQALQGARSKLDRRYLIPGEQHSHQYGLYTYPTELAAGRGQGYTARGIGSPARLDISMPRNKVLQSQRERPEVLIQEPHMRDALSSTITPVRTTP